MLVQTTRVRMDERIIKRRGLATMPTRWYGRVPRTWHRQIVQNRRLRAFFCFALDESAWRWKQGQGNVASAAAGRTAVLSARTNRCWVYEV